MTTEFTHIQKTNRLLQIFLAAFLLIAFRIWHLAVIQREDKLIDAQRPQRRTIVEQAPRGAITDRFGISLAENRISYSASVYYGQFSQIPATVWKTENGQKVRCRARKEYIRRFAGMLGKELSMDASRLEDLIHAKASLFPHIPFIIRSNISEGEYYRLKSLERQWPGLHAQIALARYYPLGKVASPVLGYLGAISQKEYLAIAEEIDSLKQMIAEGNDEEDIVARYRELKEKAYTINDLVGKAGLEKQYEEELRGSFGKKIFEIDQKGNCLRELSGGREAVAGQTVVLSLSAELQQFCENLLIEKKGGEKKNMKQPFIKGGAIVAIDPKTGEVLALAGSPRFDPNDFILTSDRDAKIPRVRRWQESERYIGDLWDGKARLYREGDDETPLSWDAYLNATLPLHSPIRDLWSREGDIKTAIRLQEDFEALLYFAGDIAPPILIDLLFPDSKAAAPKAPPAAKMAGDEALKKNIHEAIAPWRRLENTLREIPDNGDKLFVLDMCRMAVYSPAFTDELIARMGLMKLSDFRALTQCFNRAEEILKNHCRPIFAATEFNCWRDKNQKEFLQQKRQIEKENKAYARPYTDYLDQKERELFEEFWLSSRLSFMAAILQRQPLDRPAYFPESLYELPDWEPLRKSCQKMTGEDIMQWLKTMRSYRELDRPLWGACRYLRGNMGEQTERALAAAFYPIGGFGYCRCQATQTAAPMGSIFKLVTAYEAMRQSGSAASPMSINDEIRYEDKGRSLIVARATDGKPIFRHYKGGRLPRSHLPNIGKVDLLGAIEQSSNPYFALLASDYLSDPEDLTRAAADFGLGERTGVDLPDENKGRLPSDVKSNRTGLYSFAIGQHTLVTTPIQVACMISTLANHGQLLTPVLARSIEGGEAVPNTGEFDPMDDDLGIDQSLSAQERKKSPQRCLPIVRRKIDLPAPIRGALFEGMDRVVWGEKGNARPSAIKGLYGQPLLYRDFLSLEHQMIGKTSTAEILCRLDSNPSAAAQIYKHVWFGAIAFPPSELAKHKNRWDNPELVVIVYHRFGDGGKEAAPIAAEVICKWREIRKQHGM